MKRVISLAATALLFVPGLAAGAQTPVPTSPGAVPLRVVLEVVNDPTAARMTTYVAALSDQIQNRWITLLGPEANRPLPDGQEAEISVTINPDGHPSDVKVMHKTKDEPFDKAARQAITGGMFPPLPTGLPKPDLKLRVHFRVQLYPTQPGPPPPGPQ